jgi:hypothetical protein
MEMSNEDILSYILFKIIYVISIKYQEIYIKLKKKLGNVTKPLEVHA